MFRHAILKAAGKESKLLTDLIPTLNCIIGEQEDVAKHRLPKQFGDY
jgi:hypothetical protein